MKTRQSFACFSAATTLALLAVACLSHPAVAQVTPGFDFNVDATLDTDADNRWEDTVGTTGFDFELVGSVTRNTGVSGFAGIGAAYEFTGGATGNAQGALLRDAGTGTDRSFQTAPGDWSNNNVSIEVWFKPDNLTPSPSNGQIIFEDGGGTGFGFFVDNNELQLRKQPNSGLVSSNISSISSEFVQAVGTFNTGGSIELFINGVSVGVDNPSGNDWSGGDPAAVATRGGANTGGIGGGQSNTESFDGQIAIFRVYDNQVLNDFEVGSNYQAVVGNVVHTGSTIEFDAEADVNGNSVAEDQNGTGFNATLTNGAARVSPASGSTLFNASYEFDGSNQQGTFNSYETIAGNPSDASATFEFWFKPDTLTGDQVIWETGGTTDGSTLTLQNDVLEFFIIDNASNTLSVQQSIAGMTDEFLHAVAVYERDASGTDDTLRFFINGIEVGSDTDSAVNDWSGSDNGSFAGNSNANAANVNGNYDGQIAVHRLYEGVFSEQQVGSNFLAVTGDELFFDAEIDSAWDNPTNWDPNLEPTIQDAVINGGNTANVNNAGEIAANVIVGSSLTGGDGAGSGTLNINSGGDLTTGSLTIGDGANDGNVTINNGGTLTVTGNTTNVDSLGGSTLTIAGVFNDAGDVNAGLTSGGTGTINLEGTGNATIGGDINLGTVAGSTGIFNINGAGTIALTGDITDGAGTSTINMEADPIGLDSTNITVDNFNINDQNPGGDVTYTRSGGTLNVNNNLRLGGDNGHTGNVTQTGGAVDVSGDLLFGGFAAGSNFGGTYNLDGGTLNVDGDIIEGDSGSPNANINTAQLHIDGGTLTVGGDITVQRFAVGNDAGQTGSYTADAGQSITSTGTTAIGAGGTGTLDLTAAGASLTSGNAIVGEAGAGNGEVTIDNGNTWTVNDFLDIGRSGTGVVNLDSGTLDVNGGLNLAENGSGDGTLIIGTVGGSGTGGALVEVNGGNTETANAGDGQIIMHNGTFNQNTNNIIVGQGASSSATFTINDGEINAANQLRIANNGEGTFNQNGGTVNVTDNLDIANNNNGVREGEYNMAAGNLNVLGSSDLIVGNAGIGRFNQTGGTATIGGQLIIGDDNNANSNGTVTIDDPSAVMTVNGGGATSQAVLVGNQGTGTLEVLRGTLNANDGLQIGSAAQASGVRAGTMQVGSTGGTDADTTVVVNGGNTEVGTSGDGTLTIDSGLYHQDSSNFVLAQNNGSDGTVEVNGGELRIDNDLNFNRGTSEFTINGGEVNVGADGSGNIQMANFGSGTATLNINGGTLDVANAIEVGGDNNGGNDGGLANIVQTGGDVTAATILVAHENGSSGSSYDISGGTITSGQFEIGHRDPGEYIQSGGDVDVIAGNFVVGQNDAGAQGTATISGGTLDVTNDFNLGNRDGTVNQTGGNITANRLVMAPVGGSVSAEYNLTGDAAGVELTTIGNMIVGETAGVANFNQSAGQVVVGDTLRIGEGGSATGTFAISGGTTTVTTDTDVAVAGTGTLNQTGGTFFNTGNMNVGTSGGTGAVSLTGGIMDFQDSSSSQANVPQQFDPPAAGESTLTIGPSGTFALNGTGNLRDVRHIDASNTADGNVFTQLGGTFTIGSDVLGEDPAFSGGALDSSADVAALNAGNGVSRFVSVIGNGNADWTETGVANYVTGGGTTEATLEVDIFGDGGIFSGEGTSSLPGGGTSNPLTLVTDSDLLIVEGVVDASAGLTIEANWLYDPFENPLEFYDVLYATEGFTDDSVFNLAGDATLFRIVDDGMGGQFLQVAAPEPATIVVWSLIGICLFGGAAWRRRSQMNN